MTIRRARWAIVFGAAAAATGLMLACTGGDDTVAGKVNPAGPTDQDATTGTDAPDQPDTLAPPGAPLCNKYPNGPALVAKITSDLLNTVGSDCRISAYFVAPKSGAAHLSQCLESQIATFFQCPGAAYTTDQAGNACRTMADAHKGMGLRSADFDAFIADLVTVFKANGISVADINAVKPTFTGTESAIVPNLKGLGNSQCTCPNDIAPDGGYCGLDAGILIDAGDAGDAGDTGVADAPDDGG
jgi:hypothetical protein